MDAMGLPFRDDAIVADSHRICKGNRVKRL